METYLQEGTYYIKSVRFDCFLGKGFEGQGFLSWKPDSGFLLEAYFENPPLAIDSISFPTLRLDKQSIIMKSPMFRLAFTPEIIFNDYDYINLISNKRLSKRLRAVVFLQRAGQEDPKLTGKAILQTKGKLLLPDIISKKEFIQGVQTGTSYQRSALRYEDDKMFLDIRTLSDEYLNLTWSLERDAFHKYESWTIPEAVRDAFSIIHGQTLGIVKRQIPASYPEIGRASCRERV